MKKLKLLLFLTILLFPGKELFCQKLFRDGYIVKTSGETLNGLVEFSAKQDIPPICTFKRFDIARKIDYAAWEIAAFGYTDGNRYESREIDNKISFYEVIVTGKIILYRKESKFYVDKDHLGLVELKNGPLSYPSNGISRDFRSLPEFLNYLTEGKSANVPDKFDLKSEIIPLITAYNKDSGQPYNIFNRNLSDDQFSQITLNSGAGKTKFGLECGINVYMLNLSTSLKIFMPHPQAETSIISGLTYERLLSRVTDKFSMRIELLYYKQTFYCYTEEISTNTLRNDVFFNFTGIKIPILFQYSATGKKIVPFFNTGFAYQLNNNQKYTRTEEIENSIHEIRTYTHSDMSFKPSEISAIGGIGVRKKTGDKLIISFQGRLEVGSGIFAEFANKDLTFRQMSVQANFLLGITF